MEYHTIFFHGWGYDASFWHNHIKRFYSSQSVSCYNRGYYNNFHKPKLIGKNNRAVTHSMGLYFLLLEYDITQFNDIIIYAGFTKFPNKVAAKAMRLGIKNAPNKVIDNFHTTCHYTPYYDKNLVNIQSLENDLKILENLDITALNHWQNLPSYTAYHGDNDDIVKVPLEKAIILKNTGHLCNLI